MEFKQYYEHFFNYSIRLLSDPKKFWEGIRDHRSEVEVFRSFYVPYVIVAGIAVFIGNILSSPEILFSYCFMSGIREIATFLVFFFLATAIIGKVAEYFKGTNDEKGIELIIGFSMLPSLLAAIITSLFPGLYVLGLIGLYSFYLFYTGVSSLLDIHADLKIKFSIAAIVAGAASYGILNMVFWKLLQAFV